MAGRADSLRLVATQRVIARVSQGVIAVGCAWVLWTLLGNDPRWPVGIDYQIVVHAAARWMSGGPFYMLYQLAGPYGVSGYPVASAPIMYPPGALYLFALFTLLPAFLWWAVPAALSAWPVWWAWPLMAAGLLYPRTVETFQNGNPAMWVLAAGMAGAAFGWPWAFVLCKPTLGLFSLLGAYDRRWWLALGALVLVALPFGALWEDYARVAVNLQPPSGFLWHDWPLAAVAAVAWAGSPGRGRARWRGHQPGNGSVGLVDSRVDLRRVRLGPTHPTESGGPSAGEPRDQRQSDEWHVRQGIRQ